MLLGLEKVYPWHSLLLARPLWLNLISTFPGPTVFINWPLQLTIFAVTCYHSYMWIFQVRLHSADINHWQSKPPKLGTHLFSPTASNQTAKLSDITCLATLSNLKLTGSVTLLAGFQLCNNINLNWTTVHCNYTPESRLTLKMQQQLGLIVLYSNPSIFNMKCLKSRLINHLKIKYFFSLQWRDTAIG